MEIFCKNNGFLIRLKIDCPENVNNKFKKTYKCREGAFKEFGALYTDCSGKYIIKCSNYRGDRDYGQKRLFFDMLWDICEATTHIKEFKT